METEHRRRWFQFTLRGLLILTLLVASFFGGRASMQRKVYEADSRARMDRDLRDLANKQLVRLIEEINEFKKRHGIPLQEKIGDVHITKATEGHRPTDGNEQP
jgi:hypothetical protein